MSASTKATETDWRPRTSACCYKKTRRVNEGTRRTTAQSLGNVKELKNTCSPGCEHTSAVLTRQPSLAWAPSGSERVAVSTGNLFGIQELFDTKCLLVNRAR
jgi:hypothetical protein